jgi:hypothetical protein
MVEQFFRNHPHGDHVPGGKESLRQFQRREGQSKQAVILPANRFAPAARARF